MQDIFKAKNTQRPSAESKQIQHKPVTQYPDTNSLLIQQAISWLIVLVGLGYLVLIPTGVIKKKLEPVDAGILATIILANSGIISKIRKLSISKDGLDIEAAIDEIDKKVDSNKEEIDEEIETLKQKHEQEKQANLKLMEEIDLHLSGTILKRSNFDTLKELMNRASPGVSEYVYHKTKDFRHRVAAAKREAEYKGKPYGKEGEIERTIDVFRALIEQDYGKNRHQFYAQLGYSLKDQDRPTKKEWEKAALSLDRAIKLWEEDHEFSDLPPYYCFNWIACTVELYHQDEFKTEYNVEKKKLIADRMTAAVHCPQLADTLRCPKKEIDKFQANFDEWSKAQSSWLDVNKIVASSKGACHRVDK